MAKAKLIYKDEYITISNDPIVAVPGFYTIKPSLNKKSITELSDVEFGLLTYFQKQLRAWLKNIFNVELCGLYIEEYPHKKVTSYTMPFHIDRLSERFSTDIYQPYIEEYLKSYTFLSSGRQIDAFNSVIKGALDESNVKSEIEDIKKGVFVHHDDLSSKAIKKSESASKIEEVLEVFDEGELPSAPSGKKYFVCIGGKKNFQCFLSDASLSKGEFIVSHEDKLDDCLKVIYRDDHILVRQDAKYAIPGFYIVSPRLHYRRIDEMPRNSYERCMRMAQNIERGLLTLGLSRSHIYHDEKYKNPASVHFWVLPIYEKYIEKYNLNPTIFSRDIWTYLDVFPRYKDTKEKILDFNEKMRHYLKLSVG